MKYFSIVLVCALVILSPACGRKGPGNSGDAATLDELNRALNAVTLAHAEFPPSTNDLEEFLKLEGKTMPVAPAGKKLFLDTDARQYMWVDSNSK